MKKYDYIILGTGPAAYQLIKLLATQHKSILVVESGLFGGTCPNVGCEPKIYLDGAVQAILSSRQFEKEGIISQIGKLNWSQLMKEKKERFASWPNETRKNISKISDVISGSAHFVDRQTIEVNRQYFQGNRIIIATGRRPHELSIPGAKFLHDSSDVLSLGTLPEHTTFIGGGYVAMELATFLAAAGSQVTILVRGDRVLRHFYQKYSRELVVRMKQRGIQFEFETEPTRITRLSDKYVVELNQDGPIVTDYVVNASGRMPNIEKLDLSAAQIDYSTRGIDVDRHLQTNVKNIYAIGDVTSQDVPNLTPVAEFQAQYLFNSLEKGLTQPINYPAIGTGVFAFPQLAQAGINPDSVLEDGDNFEIREYELSQSSLYAGQKEKGLLTVVYDKANYIVGVSEISMSAVNDINYFVPIIGLRINKNEWHRNVLPIYPALADKIEGILR
ncbi:dihydrolipoyl dehydrogenase family protein [Lactobacillus johnsonii]|uniref:Pyridine nucleotide-disulfide oxidoreductase n=1 Tax=Lactobacillus johnsonii TaxID=33959 RepID=A0A9W3SMM3_LACJH|nr:NAD(P)/FAD-dependent oxidoreductase [Lactobacillus johnsonii]AOG26455.1 pyridine nucleotide-disulfide oxidoreductase [Lactobacillus johnsonii]MCI5549398.1 NAD(P)/FAD-dependent oxidoreductase [Lactobacillus johnsonii]MCI6762268.1 NAD(P)/FAD-dependent oxidoreductase [Lactobacillus johnsonii]MDD7006199.1 NAD(P)/FAD-dependent oxidoreductase [Lactobacillus johnsonii]MDY5067490.1 NAD(P)/FAD-dependent oxidoreductase [Lactobacillus johnsonii]